MVRENVEMAAMVIVAVSFIPIVLEIIKHRRQTAEEVAVTEGARHFRNWNDPGQRGTW